MIDRLAQKASEDLRGATAADLEAGLREVYDAHSRHRRVTRLAAAAAVLAALGTGWWGGHALTGSRSDGPATPVSPTSTPSATTGVCTDALVSCQPGRHFRFDLVHPVLWRIPRGQGVNSGSGASPRLVESYARDGSSGVTVLEDVTAASQREPAAPAPGARTTAEGFIAWIASRPYFDATAPRETELGGRQAWHVRLTLHGSATDGPARCLQDTTACRAVTSTPTVTGVWGDMVADYTAIDLPGAGTTVVWSWAFGSDADAKLRRNLSVVRGISWPG